jgi:peptidoglycan hydrolase-like protein with peptidoglycan-binding domain
LRATVTAACRPLRTATAIVLALACATGAVLTTDAPAAGSSDHGVVKRGDRGAAVKRIQRRLHVRPVDGVFGRITERAVKRFQRRKGIEADGVVGPATREAMGLATISSGSAGAYTDPGVALPRVLRQIAKCESGGNPTAVSANGRYRGKYQFTRSTWRALGGHGDPAAAAEGTQDRIALKLYRRSGTAPWPSCA